MAVVIVASVAGLTGCSPPTVEGAAEQQVPLKGYKKYASGISVVQEFVLSDGTRCVSIGVNQGGITCDWGRP
jgi:hypothetical protein